MLAKIAPASRDFKALSDYLVRGKGQTSDTRRVAWIKSRKLPTEEPDVVSRMMAATARLSVRVRNPVYHVMIAWAPHERPAPEVMEAIAVQTLELTGLGEYQALLIGHGDTAHPHLHMMINKVHPETGKAWRSAHDFRLFDRVMRQLSEAHGFTHAPSHAFNPEQTQSMTKLPSSRARRAAARGAHTARPQWSREAAKRISARMSEHLNDESERTAIVAELARLGLQIEAKGRGHIVGNDTGYVKASALSLLIGTRTLEFQRGGARQLRLVDGVDIVRALRVWGLADDDDLKRAVDDAQLERTRRRNDPSRE